MNKYFNYHKHTYSSNVSTIDCTVSNEDYAKRSIELGHEWLSSCEHGGMINWVDCYNSSLKHNLKYIHCGEFYFVRDRLEKDKSNYHLIIVAKTKEGFYAMNDIMSTANIDGFYYKARIDMELLRSLPKDSVYVTTACIGGFLRDYEDNKDILLELKELFGDNLFLEVQPHETEKQIEYNKNMKQLSEYLGIKLIGACDSHAIYKEQEKDRDYLLKSKGLVYEDEGGWFLDFPNYDELKNRFMSQNMWSDNEVEELLKNTLILTETESIIIDKKIKVPTIFPNKNRDWKLGHLKKIINESWNKYKQEVPKEEWGRYYKEILLEFSIIEETSMEDYFISNYYIIKRGVELGGVITRSGRGSGASFVINMLLGFTTIDRLKSRLPIIPHRFMSVSRILEENQAPDIDFNIYHREFFLQAQDELFGSDSNFLMVTWGALGIKSAFKMLCRAKDISVDTANEVSKLISAYDFDKKHNEDVDIENYIKEQHHIELIEESKKYQGIIDNMSEHPCATVLYNGNLKREVGVIRTPNGEIVANITGEQSESLGFLKNDFLIVDVVDLNDRLYKKINREYMSAQKLYIEIEDNKEVFELFEKGYTLCLNQFETSGTTQKMMKYKPSTVEEVANSVASIRPGFASNYKAYESRDLFEYGIPFIDKLLKGDFIESSFMMYQEQQMLLLMTIGVKMDKIVSTIKAISKKKQEVIDKIAVEFEEKLFDLCLKNGETDEEKVRDIISRLWKIFVDSSRYAFNTPHSISTATDCLHTALVKHLYPIDFYEVALEKYSEKKNVNKMALLKNEAYAYKQIIIPPMKYGQNNTSFTSNKEKNEIYQSLLSVKTINTMVSEEIYKISQEFPNIDFFSLYLKMKEAGLSKTHISNLVKIGYFEEIEKNKNKCLWLCDNFDNFKKTLKKDKIDIIYKNLNLEISLMDFYKLLKDNCVKETEKQLSFNELDLIKLIYSLVNVDIPEKLRELYWQCDLLSTTIENIEDNFLLGRVVKYNSSTKKIVFKHIKSGVEQWMKLGTSTHIKEKDIIFIESVTAKTFKGREYYTAQEIENLSEKFSKKSLTKVK